MLAARLSSCFSLPTSSLCDQVSRKSLWCPEPGGFLPPHAVTTEFKSPSILCPMLQGAALHQRLLDTWRRCLLWELLELAQREEENKDSWVIMSSAAALLLAQTVPFLSMETQLARQHWLLLPPHTPLFEDALVGVTCTEKQLL